ncbi:type II toxin-antitoxin system RelE family toxin [Halovenus marina]|uniref:type II toxin-antitoxin system RelE family toxin n=1 Tax=Halovenus marina TaxID=3396621 RepID=UPI003F5653A0
MAEVVVSDNAAEWLRDAEPDVRDRIVNKPNEISDFPNHYLKRLRNSPHYWFRIGDHRLTADWRNDKEELFVRDIGYKRNIYD